MREAVALPAAFGVNVTVNGSESPAAMVVGRVIPETTNSLLLLVAEATVTVVPAALKLALSDELDPKVTLPKLRDAGATDSWPWVVPMPESEMFSGELEEFETMEMDPLTAPVPLGVKIAVNVKLWFGLSVVGKVNPLIEKPAPFALASEIVSEEFPVLVSVSNNFVLPPT